MVCLAREVLPVTPNGALEQLMRLKPKSIVDEVCELGESLYSTWYMLIHAKTYIVAKFSAIQAVYVVSVSDEWC